MSIIDDKGRILGKINVIDFLVILFLILLIPAFYFGYRILTKRPQVEVPEKEFIEIETNCRLIRLNPELLNDISAGVKELDEDGQVIGEIISLGQPKPYKYEFDIGGQIISKEDAILKQVEARLMLRAEVKEFTPYYKDKKIEVGSPLEFKTDNFTFTAIPVEEGKEVPEKEFIEIETNCRLIRLNPELLNDISAGVKELDEDGQVIGEIISLGQPKPYKYEFDIGGEKIIKEDAILKQVEARLKLRAEVKEFTPYYKDKKIEVGSPLEFKTDNFTFTAIPVEEGKEEERIINLYVTLIDLDKKLLKDISVGDKETDENGQPIAEILSLEKVEESSLKFDLGSGSIVKEEEGTKKQISARMRLKCQVKNGSQLYFKGKKVEYNSPLEFKTDKYEITGFVTLKEKWIRLRVKFSKVVPEVARIIQKGNVEKDVLDRTVAIIAAIISNEPALIETITDEGKFMTLNHPFHRDLVVYIDVLCEEKEGAYYFKDHLAKMGNEIVFNTESYSISGMILGMQIK